MDKISDRLWEEYEDMFTAWLDTEIETLKLRVKDLERIRDEIKNNKPDSEKPNG